MLAASDDGRAIIRHSTAHVLAQAVQDLFPDAKLGIGPPVENGFYYDFDVATPFTPEDLAKLEKKMQQIIKERQRFSRRVVSDDDARAELAAEPYKLELIGIKGRRPDAAEGASVEVGGGELTIYDNIRRDDSVAWKDLCRGPHVPATGYLGNFKLMRVGGGVLAGEREEPAAAADLRHRVGDPRRAEGVPDPAGGGRQARPPQAGHRAGPVQLPRRDRFRPRGVPPQGRRTAQGDGGLLAPAARRGRLRVRLHAAHHQGAAVRDLGPPGLVRRRHVPAHAPGRGARRRTGRSASRARTTT